MVIHVYWTHFTKNELKKIFKYYEFKASRKVASDLVEGIINKGNSLNFQIGIGQREELLINRKEEFRYLVFKNYKIIYWFNDAKNRVEITDVFDARQNPIKLNRQK
ncbi:type II toxin-antitoxin system RelE/ParE family toxin [Kaistella jeonii]|uniref:Plasmid stabilization protein n=1 Tax=Kaistella jeonii TaxID=266749 RepID=A0A0C1F8C1_9FLAO|nr:type II toxin-antitoxin system RelE/ParE family toxin [Kaistella jeonii]KIA88133.1 plasmid stabilization protein [Kaistella jeonii]SFC28938.1 ParE toxin of type II toxin-antitoxin system, parDE [Kaistella jeonii]VEI96905.1 Uncharacterised protein [Kaistella jeonii]